MTVRVTHSFRSEKLDGEDRTQVQPSHWNDSHAVEMLGPGLLGRVGGDDGAAQEIAVGAGLLLDGQGLRLDPGAVATVYLGAKTAAEITAINAAIAAGTANYPAGSYLTLSSSGTTNGTVYQLMGVGTAALFQPPVSGGGSGGATSIPFSTALNFRGDYDMGITSVAGAIAMTADVSGAIAGKGTRVTFVGNAANVPAMPSGAAESASSFGYDNTVSGYRNWLDIWWDGVGVVYQWSQPTTQTVVTPPPVDTTAPTVSGVSVANASPTVVAVAFSETMNTGAAPAASAFTIAGHTVASVAWSGNILNLTVTPPFANGEPARTLAYAQPGANNLRDVAGNLLANVSAAAITNNVQPSDTTAPSLTSAVVNGATLTLTYNETLNGTAPAASAYSVVGAGGVTQTPSAVSISGAVVSLTLATPAVNGNTVTVGYTVPGSNPVRDAAGNAAAALTGQAVTNSTSSGDDFADWLARLTAAGGDASTTEKDAVQAFITTAKTGATPFWDVLHRANAFVNNAAGSLVPFKIQGGSSNDTSPAATAVNAGGRANTLGTGYVDTQTPAPGAAGGLSVYLRDIQSFSPAAANVIIGARDAAQSQAFRIAGNIRADASAVAGYVSGAWGGAAAAQMESNLGAAMQVGHWHVHRSSNTSLKLRRNGALVGAEFVASTTATPISETIFVFGQNGGGTAGAFTKTPTSIGYYAILSGAMTDAQATAYNTAVVALMTAMGRNL